MRKYLKEIKPVEIIEIICDDCGKKINRPHTCCMCHKDLCEECRGTLGTTGDYPPVYCKDCLDIGEYYIKTVDYLKKEYEEKCEALSNDWRENCLERRRIKGRDYESQQAWQDESNH